MYEENQTYEGLFIDAADLIRQGREEHEKLATQVVIEDGHIGFPGQGYWVKLSKINSYKKLMGWVTHFLESKDWITPQMLLRFIELVAIHNRLNVYQTR